MRQLKWAERHQLVGAVAGLGVAAFSSGVARADCSPLTSSLTDGQTADAAQVMNDFNGILSCGRFTGIVAIGEGAPGDVGMVGGLAVNGTSSTQVEVSQNGTPAFAMNVTNGAWFLWDKATGSWANSMESYGGHIGIAGTAATSYALYVNGQGYATGGWASPSDGRLKKDVVEIDDAIGLVEQLRGVRFLWRSPDERDVGKALVLPMGQPQLGLIAQEVRSVVPEAVTPPSADDGLLGLKSDQLVPVLVEAIKEQQAEIDQLKAEVARLGRATVTSTVSASSLGTDSAGPGS